MNNELRIGNLLNWNAYGNKGISHVVFIENRAEHKTSFITPSLQLESGATAHQCSPINISEECLIKIGFQNDGEDLKLFPNFNTQIIYFKEGVVQFYTRSINSDYLLIHLSYDIRYIHQLQNLCFALTGVELIYNYN